jgi:hypothetical protein
MATNYIPAPQYLASETEAGYLITVTPGPVPTLESYNYYDQTVVVANVNSSSVYLDKIYITAITVN